MAKKREIIDTEVTGTPAVKSQKNQISAYGDNLAAIEYNREIFISGLKPLVAHSFEVAEVVGRLLIIMHEKEGRNFTRIVEEELEISRKTAYRWMNVAKTREKYPNIPFEKFKKSVTYHLLEASDEDLQAFEETGTIGGYDIDDITSMSKKEANALILELRAKNKKYEVENDKIIEDAVKERTEAQEMQIAHLEAEKQALLKRLPSATAAEEFYINKMSELKDILEHFVNTANDFIYTEDLKDNRPLQNKIDFKIETMELAVSAIRAKWDEFLDSED